MSLPVATLIIENDFQAAETFRRRLRSLRGLDLEVFCCAHGGETCACVTETSPRIVFVQYLLGNLRGSTVVERLARKNPDKPSFVLYSPVGGEQIAMAALRCGAADCIEPGNLSDFELVILVKRLLQRQEEILNLQAAAHNYTSLIETSSDAVAIFQDNALRFVNEALAELTGYTAEQLVGTDASLLLAESDLQLAHQRAEQRIGETGEAPTQYETKIRHQDGRIVPVEVRAGLVSHRGRPAVFAFVRDRSESQQTKLALQSSEDKYQALFSKAKDAIFLFREGRITDCNEQAEVLLGFRREEMLGSTGQQFLPKAEGTSGASALSPSFLALAQDQPQQFERVLKRADGLLLEVEVGANLVQLADGPLLQVMVRDITARKRWVEELQQSQERYDLVVRGSADGIWDWDRIHQHEVYISPHLQEMLGLADAGARLEIANLLALVHPGDRGVAELLTEPRLGEKDAFDIEIRVRHADGHYIWLRNRGIAQRDAAGALIRMAGTSRDITNQRVADEMRRLRESHLQDLDRVARLLSAAHQLEDLPAAMTRLLLGMFRVDQALLLGAPRGEIPGAELLMVAAAGNPMLEEGQLLQGMARLFPRLLEQGLLTLSSAQAVDAGLGDWWRDNRVSALLAVSIQPAAGPGWVLLLAQCAYGRIWKDAEKTLAREIASRLADTLASRLLWQELQADITKRKQAEEELLRHRDHLQELVDEQVADLRVAKEIAESAKDAMTGFLANMSHELRTPLHGILSFASIGAEKVQAETEPHLANYFQRIRDSGAQLLGLLNDLLDLSRLEAGKMAYEFAEHDLADLVSMVLDEEEANVLSKRLVVSVHGEHGVSFVANLDRGKIVQVVRNLLSNAIKFCESGNEIHLEQQHSVLVYQGKDRVWRTPAVTLSISNRGPAVPEDELEVIFDKFTRGRNVQTWTSGTGLGLAICKEIIAAHRGAIGVQNNYRYGTRFHFTIPVQSPLTIPDDLTGAVCAGNPATGSGSDLSLPPDPQDPATSATLLHLPPRNHHDRQN